MKRLLPILFLLISGFSYGKVRFVRAMVSGDASTSITIGWDQVSGSEVKFFLRWSDTASFVQIADMKEDNYFKGMHNYFIRLTELKPKQKYEFKIEDSEGSSKIYWFTTASDKHDSVSFIAGGDSRTRREPRRLANLMVSKLRPDAVLFNGDMTSQDTEKEWHHWLEDWELTIDSTNHVIPIIAGRGNHEKSNRTLTKIFAVPNAKVYYSAQYGTDFINTITLNSEIWKGTLQKLFLKKTLKNHQHFTWQIPQYHRPVRPHVGHKREMNNQRKHFVTLFEKYGVRLVLECDAHTCKTTYPIVMSDEEGSHEGFKRDDKNGIVYIGEGCWGAPLRQPDDQKPWTRDAEAIDSFKWLFVFEDKIEVRTVKYSNVNDVEPVPNRFDIPENLDIWNPKNGGGEFSVFK